ncbi:MAG TPA: hypothetical protein VLR90_08725, partial [Blastocatellia bacterium]|nr:hypothetical protein [Blastocatellia bacterium]
AEVMEISVGLMILNIRLFVVITVPGVNLLLAVVCNVLGNVHCLTPSSPARHRWDIVSSISASHMSFAQTTIPVMAVAAD